MRIIVDFPHRPHREFRSDVASEFSVTLLEKLSKINSTSENLVAPIANDLKNELLSIQILSRPKYLNSLLEQEAADDIPIRSHDLQKIYKMILLNHYAKQFPDILHFSHFSLQESLQLDAYWIKYLKNITCSVSLYDVMPVIFQNVFFSSLEMKNKYYQMINIIKHCNYILTFSETTRHDAINYLSIPPDKIIKITPACSDVFKVLSFEDKINKYDKKLYCDLNENFIFAIADNTIENNIETLVKAYAALPLQVRTKHQLLIISDISLWDKENIEHYASNLGLRSNDVILQGFHNQQGLAYLYNKCALFVYLTSYDGLGMRVLEAMKCGAPVIGVNHSSSREIMKKDEYLFNHKNNEEITEILLNILTNTKLREEMSDYSIMRAKAYTWDKTSNDFLGAFRYMVEKKKSNYSRSIVSYLPLKKIAFFSPLPKQQSGVAEYSEHLLRYLSYYFDIDLFIDDYQVDNEWITNNFKIYNYREYQRKYKEYDETIFHIGNSHYHAYMYQILLEYGGIIVLHDFFLSGLFHHMSTNENLLEQELIYSHGKPAINDFLGIEEPQRSFQMMIKYPCNKRVLESARGIIVHSNHALDLIKTFYSDTIVAPVYVIRQMHNSVPMLRSLDKINDKIALGFTRDDFVICNFGFLGISKLNDVILDGFIKSKLYSIKNIKLCFVGEIPKNYFEEDMNNRIRQAGLTQRVVITGYVDNEVYNQYLRIADMAIQLRSLSRGENSRTILDCLAYGIPSIINNYAIFSEFPDDIIYKIPSTPSIDDVALAFNSLYENASLRNKLPQLSTEYINKYHLPVSIAEEYTLAIHECINKNLAATENFLIKEISNILSPYQNITRRVIKNITFPIFKGN